VQSNVSTLVLSSRFVVFSSTLVCRVTPVLLAVFALAVEYRVRLRSPADCEFFEVRLQELLRELGRRMVEWTYNHIEPDDPSLLPPQIEFEREVYRRRGKSPHRGFVSTLFGSIKLVRCLYQPFTPGEPAIFPLEIKLGIEAGGATPALALRVSQLAASMTQQQTLDVLRLEHNLCWSVTTLRKLLESMAEQLSSIRHKILVDRILDLLRQANESKGPRKIVFAVGRDGLMLPMKNCQSYQEGATATITVYGRSGKRFGTVYLGQMPQSGQGTLSEQLTRLIQEVLARWQGPLPRLCYVTDAGFHPTDYFRNTLRCMRHPVTNKPLVWQWVVDYFHVCGYISKLAEAIFGEGKEAAAWARKMRRWLKDKANGAYRLLHSAAALRDKRGLKGSAQQFADACRFLRNRLPYLNYTGYRRRGLPIGSGVTEAACKTVFTYRFKQSGMKWTNVGGQMILDLRVLLLSGVWNQAADAYLAHKPTITLQYPTEFQKTHQPFKIAA